MSLMPKATVDADEGRSKREVGIRKRKREHLLVVGSPETTLEHLPEMIANLWSNDNTLQLKATTQFCKLLCVESAPPINEVIQSGVVPRFVQFLLRANFPQLQYEAAWALINITSGTSENVNAVVKEGAVPIFVQLLCSTSDKVQHQAIWALGNIAYDSPKCRNLVLSSNALKHVLRHLTDNDKLSVLRTATWTLSNFCRGKPRPPFKLLKRALPVLERLIHSKDEEVLTDACWALSYISDYGTTDTIQAVIDSRVCAQLVELLVHSSPMVLIPALRTVGNIVTGDEIQTQCMINHKALPNLLKLLTDNFEKSIKKEACWTISNITAGNKEQIQEVIDAGIFVPLVHLLETAEFDVKKEAGWGILNATSGGTHDQIKFIVSQGCIMSMCDLIACPDPRIVTVCLEGFENILKVGEADKEAGLSAVNLFAQMIENAGGLEKIENLQSHFNTEIYEKSVKILETYWLEEYDEATPPVYTF